MLLGGAALLLAANVPQHTLVAGGDVMVARHTHLSLDDSANDRWLEPLGDELREADLVLVNLECVVSTRGRFHRKPESRPYFYRARPEMLDALTSVGVDVVTVANNHSLDYGPDALIEEMELLEAAGIAPVGGGRNRSEAHRPTYVRVGDVILAVFAADASVPSQRFFGATPRRAGVVQGDVTRDDLVEELRPEIEEARRHAHIVVFSPHWGTNWTDGPDEHIRRLAHAFIDAGVDVILGHSSHQFHGVEIYREKLIVYDMGSLLFDRVGQRRMRKSFLFRLRFDASGVRRLELLPVRLRTNVTRPSEGAEADEIRTLFRRLTHQIDDDLVVEESDDGWLAMEIPHPSSPRSIEPPADARPVGRTKRLPSALRRRRPDVFVEELPEGLRDHTPVDLGGVEYLGALLPELVPERHDVIVELFLRAKRTIRQRRTLVISGVERDSGCRHGEWAEPGDWAVPTNRWRPGEIVRHRVALRSPGTCGAGVFDMEVELRDPRRPPSGTKAKVGTVRAFESRRRRQRLVEPTVAFAAGRPGPTLPPPPPPETDIGPWIVAACAVVLVGLVLFFSWRHRRRVAASAKPPDDPTQTSPPSAEGPSDPLSPA